MTVSQATQLDQLCVNAIRFLSVDGVQKANSGHPGAPMGAAPMAYALWDRFLKHNPGNPEWPDRDRFILSAGHASMLLYSLLHLTGYDLSLEELKQFRQWGSKTPGHPEHGETPGVEMTTGPLGQGFATGVGMAIAERWLATKYNKPGHQIIDHYTYAIVSDGDLQEGVTSEAASIAGTLKLGKMIYLYDDNDIQIEGSTDLSFREDVGARFKAYDWQVIGPIDGNDLDAIDAAIQEAQAETERPSLIICDTIIGFGCPAQGTAKVHGEPLGEQNVLAAKECLGWPAEPTFYVPDDALAHLREAVGRGAEAEQDWEDRFAAYRKAYPREAAQLAAELAGELPAGWDAELDILFPPETKPVATRVASGKIINALAGKVGALMGGSADLAPSTKTLIDGAGDFQAENHGGRNLRFGVREHVMGSIANGLALHGGVIPYTATFLVFSDYMRPTIRLAALMGVRVVFIFTHDSIGLGEDGPTHQPIEHLMSLRAIPNLTVIRPAEATETAEAWRAALRKTDGPTLLALTRQNLPVFDQSTYPSAESRRGGYTLWQAQGGTPDVILIGTGSEVHLALEAGKALAAEGINARVVSLPSWELFDAQPAEYRESVLPAAVRARVAVEAGTTFGWERYLGFEGVAIGMQRFGASAPAEILYEQFGITAEHVVRAARGLVKRS
ncbi:MAG: transketolase [Armatimonadota bacterium]